MISRNVALILMVMLCVTVLAAAQPADPWEKFFPQGLLDRDGNAISRDVLQGKYVGIYFAASWCRTCQLFSPKMVSFRNHFASEFEVVFVSSDKSEEEQFAYMKNYGMLWPTITYKAAPALALKDLFDVSFIPMLVVLTPTGELITKEGRTDVENNPGEALATWKSMPSTPVTPVPDPARAQAATSLARLDLGLIGEANASRDLAKQGWIKGTIGDKTYFVTIDRTAWTIKGTAGDRPYDIKIDHEAKTIRGRAHDSGVDLTFAWTPQEVGFDGDAYGNPYWKNINWASGAVTGGIACSLLEMTFDHDRGIVRGTLGDRQVDLAYEKVSGRLTGQFFRRSVDLQLTNLDLTDFLQYLFLFIR